MPRLKRGNKVNISPDTSDIAAYEGYEGCFPENLRDRRFAMSPGNWESATLDPDECKRTCVDNAQGYAGLTNGELCFCA